MFLHRSLVLLLISLAIVQGQQPTEPAPDQLTPPSVPIPGTFPPPAAGAPAADIQPALPPSAPLGETKITADINEPKLSGNALAGLYRKYTGRRVIVSAAASTAEFAFVQEATLEDPLTFAQAAELLKKAATIENFVFVPDGDDPNLDILTLSTGGIRPTGRGVDVYNQNGKVYSETDKLPEGDAVITYVMPLSNIKPTEAVNIFTQIIGQVASFGSIAPVPNAAAIVITENTSLIRKLIDIKKEIDVPSSQVDTRFIKVNFADVTEIASTLTELLTAQQSAQTTAGIQRADATPAAVPPGGIPGAPAGAGASGSAESTPIQIIPDPRTNRIFAMGRPADLLFVEGLIREFDVETSEKNFLRRKLRFLTVSDFLPIASDALTRAFSGGSDSGGAGATGGAQGGGGSSRSQSRGRQSASSRGGSGSTGANFGGSSSGSSGFGGGGGSGSNGGSNSGGDAGLDDPQVSSAPESVLVGRTLLVADNITNSIVVQGPPSGLEIIERLLEHIDVKPDQVMISTVIGQLSLTDNFKLGLDFLNQENDYALRGGAGTGPRMPILKRYGPGPLAANVGLQAYGKIGNNLRVYLDALQERSDFTVLSRPSIFTSNNQKGTISSGESIAVPTGSNSFSSGGASTNIEYKKVLLKLEIIPLVNSDNEITMKIVLLNEELGAGQVIPGGGANGKSITVPGIITREIVTTATVPNNETIVLGGLIVTRNNESKAGIPLLSSIPYVGNIFSRISTEKDRSELLVFIQPSIVKNDRSLTALQEEFDTRYKVSPKARVMADGQGVLPPLGVIDPVKDKAGSTDSRAAVIRPSAMPTRKKTSFGSGNRR